MNPKNLCIITNDIRTHLPSSVPPDSCANMSLIVYSLLKNRSFSN